MTSTLNLSAQRHQATTLPNGLRILTAHNPAVDIAVVRLFFPCGSRWDPQGRWGVAHLLAQVISKGTGSLTSEAIAARVESLGAAIGTDATADYWEISLKCIASDLPDVLGLMAEIVLDPVFPEGEVARERELTLQAIQAQQERPFTMAFDRLRGSLFPGHPYALSPLGTLDSVETLTREDLVTFHQTHFGPQQAVIAAIGPQDPAVLQGLIESAFGPWIPQPILDPPTAWAAHTDPTRLIKTVQDTQQSLIMLGYRGAAASHADYAPLKLLSTYLGSGLSSRLFVELREKRGLAYEVSAFFATRRDPAPFAAYLGTAWTNTQTALEGLRAEMDRLVRDPLTSAELAQTQRKVLGQYALSKQTNAQIAQVLGWYEILGLGAEFDQTYPQQIQAVTVEQLYQVAQRYLADPVISLVGPATALDPLESAA